MTLSIPSLVMSLAMAGTPTHWDEGVAAFREADALNGAAAREAYVRSATAFAAASRESPENPETFVNLAAASYRAGMLPETIAACHAGLAVHPFDPRLHAQLAAARAIVFREPSPLKQFKPSWLRVGIVPYLGWLAAAGAMIAAVVLPAAIRSRRSGWLGVGIGGIVLAAAAAGLVALRDQAIADQANIVVVHDLAPLRSGNADAFPATDTLPPGYEVRRLGERGDWLHVQCPGGQIGWIPAKSTVASF